MNTPYCQSCKVEKGQAPDVMIASHPSGLKKVEWRGQVRSVPDPDSPATFTRPVYPYPLRAIYKGSGDPDDAESFQPVMPQ